MHKNSRSSKSRTLSSFARRGLVRLVVFSSLWYVLAGSDNASWIIGVPAVFFATALSLMARWKHRHRETFYLILAEDLAVLFFLRNSR